MLNTSLCNTTLGRARVVPCSSVGSTTVRMGASPWHSAEAGALRKTAASVVAALVVALAPEHALAAETPASKDLSPVEMLVQKTTTMQVSGIDRRKCYV